MDAYERAKAVAHYRTSILLKAHIDDAQYKAAERKRRRNKSRGRNA